MVCVVLAPAAPSKPQESDVTTTAATSPATRPRRHLGTFFISSKPQEWDVTTGRRRIPRTPPPGVFSYVERPGSGTSPSAELSVSLFGTQGVFSFHRQGVAKCKQAKSWS